MKKYNLYHIWHQAWIQEFFPGGGVCLSKKKSTSDSSSQANKNNNSFPYIARRALYILLRQNFDSYQIPGQV
jgi:hypothetical protein